MTTDRTHGTLALKGDSWRLDASPHVHIRAKRLFGKFSKQAAGVLVVLATPETAHDLRWFLARYPMAMAPPDRERLEDAADRHVELLRRLDDLIDVDYEPRAFALAHPARSYQARSAEIYLARGGLLVGDDVGLGKTVTGLCSFADPRTLPAVVVAPAHLPRQWAAMIHAFAPALTTHILKSGTPYELPRRDGRGPDVVITSYHKVNGWAKVLAAYAKSVVFDEAQELRHRGTARYGAAQYLAGQLRYRLLLSATPIYNYGDEIYSLLDLMQPDCLGTHKEFLDEWCAPVGNGKHKLKDPKAFGSWARAEFLIVRHTRQEVGRELPDVVRVPQQIGSDRAALDRIADSAADLARLILASADKQARWQASEQLSTILRQATGISKAPYVADFVRLLVESGERVLVGLWHREVYDILNAKLRDLRPAMYTGSETAAQKATSVERFLQGKAAGGTDVLLLSLRSGLGLNGLQAVCSCAVIGELDWSPGVHEQFIGRLQRDDQPNKVVAYFLVAADGSDPAVAETLGIKREQVEGIRNPTAAETFLDVVDATGSRARLLAERYLAQLPKARRAAPARPAVVEPSLFEVEA